MYGKATHTELVQKGIIVASSSTFHQWMCTIVLLCACCFFSYFIDKCMLSVSPLLCGHALACGPSMAAIHQAFCAEYNLWCSDWLELLRWLTTHTPLLHTLSCCISVKAGAHLVSCSGWQQQVSWCLVHVQNVILPVSTDFSMAAMKSPNPEVSVSVKNDT